MRQPGFLSLLQGELERLPIEILNTVNEEGGLEICDFLEQLVKPVDYSVVPSQLLQENLCHVSQSSQDHFETGKRLLEDGKVAFCFSGKIPEDFMYIKDSWSYEDESNPYYTFSLQPDNRLSSLDGKPLLRPCGSGDVVERFLRSVFYANFLLKGGRHVVFLTADSSVPVPEVIGLHDKGEFPITATVRNTTSSDNAVLLEYKGFNQLIRRFRLTEEVTEDVLTHTGSLLLNAGTDFSAFKWQWHRRKLNFQGSLEVVYQRYLEDITAHFKTQYIELQ